MLHVLWNMLAKCFQSAGLQMQNYQGGRHLSGSHFSHIDFQSVFVRITTQTINCIFIYIKVTQNCWYASDDMARICVKIEVTICWHQDHFLQLCKPHISHNTWHASQDCLLASLHLQLSSGHVQAKCQYMIEWCLTMTNHDSPLDNTQTWCKQSFQNGFKNTWQIAPLRACSSLNTTSMLIRENCWLFHAT